MDDHKLRLVDTLTYFASFRDHPQDTRLCFFVPFHVVLQPLSRMKRGQVSYLHRAVLAEPISEEDVDWNVTNPSVLVWICMLIWSNGSSGDRTMEQFDHAISDKSSAAYLWWVHVRCGEGWCWYISPTGRRRRSRLFEINWKWWNFEKLISPHLRTSLERFTTICIAGNVKNESYQKMKAIRKIVQHTTSTFLYWWSTVHPSYFETVMFYAFMYTFTKYSR